MHPVQSGNTFLHQLFTYCTVGGKHTLFDQLFGRSLQVVLQPQYLIVDFIANHPDFRNFQIQKLFGLFAAAAHLAGNIKHIQQ